MAYLITCPHIVVVPFPRYVTHLWPIRMFYTVACLISSHYWHIAGTARGGFTTPPFPEDPQETHTLSGEICTKYYIVVLEESGAGIT